MMDTVAKRTPLAQNPLFVVGYPRSGTTLLQALLATQGDLVTFPETHFFRSVFAGNSEFCETIDPVKAKDILDKIAKDAGIVFAADFLSQLQTPGETTRQIPVKGFFEALVEKLLPQGTPRSKRWLEKTPDHGLYMHHILRFYPEAKFVGIIRNPFFAIHSRTKHFPPKGDDLLGRLSTQWVKHIKAFDDFQATHPEHALLVKYEDLTKDSEGSLSDICRFLEIDFEPGKLENFQQKAEGIVQPFEHWKQDVKSSQIFTRDEDPRSIFSTGEILKIQSIVLQKMKEHGYRPEHSLLQKVYNFFRVGQR